MLLSKIDDLRGVPAELPRHDVTRRRLYAANFHRMMRIACVSMGLSMLVLVGRRATSIIENGIPWADVAGAIPVVLLLTLVLVPHLRTRALYGSPEGLEILQRGRRRLVPWSTVGTPKFAWWSFGLWRVAKVTVGEDQIETISFFADGGILEDFERMRALYTRR